MTDNLDECVDEHCLDADVFVLVVSAEATVSKVVSYAYFYHRNKELTNKDTYEQTNTINMLKYRKNYH